MKRKNPAAVALGKKARGAKKTMTPAAMAARKANIASRWAKVAKKKGQK